jgi:hypothetical protein
LNADGFAEPRGSGGAAVFALKQLQAPGPFPEAVDPSRRELYLSEGVFKKVEMDDRYRQTEIGDR